MRRRPHPSRHRLSRIFSRGGPLRHFDAARVERHERATSRHQFVCFRPVPLFERPPRCMFFLVDPGIDENWIVHITILGADSHVDRIPCDRHSDRHTLTLRVRSRGRRDPGRDLPVSHDLRPVPNGTQARPGRQREAVTQRARTQARAKRREELEPTRRRGDRRVNIALDPSKEHRRPRQLRSAHVQALHPDTHAGGTQRGTP